MTKQPKNCYYTTILTRSILTLKMQTISPIHLANWKLNPFSWNKRIILGDSSHKPSLAIRIFRTNKFIRCAECGKWANKSCSNLHVKWGWDSVTRSVKAARKLTSPRPRIKSSTDDFVLSRSLNFGSNIRPVDTVSSANLWSIAWLYATPCAEIGRHRHIHATQRDKHREYR